MRRQTLLGVANHPWEREWTPSGVHRPMLLRLGGLFGKTFRNCENQQLQDIGRKNATYEFMERG